MAREPSYPNDATVGASSKAAPPAPKAPDAAEAPPAPPAPSAPQEAKSGGDSRRTKKIVAGAAIGIGSAAIVAALLYTNRNRRDD